MKGVLIHTLTEGNGMSLANSTTPANGSEREQMIPLLDKENLKVSRNQSLNLHGTDNFGW